MRRGLGHGQRLSIWEVHVKPKSSAQELKKLGETACDAQKTRCDIKSHGTRQRSLLLETTHHHRYSVNGQLRRCIHMSSREGRGLRRRRGIEQLALVLSFEALQLQVKIAHKRHQHKVARLLIRCDVTVPRLTGLNHVIPQIPKKLIPTAHGQHAEHVIVHFSLAMLRRNTQKNLAHALREDLCVFAAHTRRMRRWI